MPVNIIFHFTYFVFFPVFFVVDRYCLSEKNEAFNSRRLRHNNRPYFVDLGMHEIREPAIAYGKQKFTIEEYLQFEKTSAEKHEYYRAKCLRCPEPATGITGSSQTCLAAWQIS